MCEFCTKHGEGKLWYLRAENYSAELREKIGAVKSAFDLGQHYRILTRSGDALINSMASMPMFLRRVIRTIHEAVEKRYHFGQILPLEDVEEILKMMSSVVRLPCLCRRHRMGKEERYCLGITIDSSLHNYKKELGTVFYANPVFDDFEFMTHEEVVSLVRKFDRMGLVHSVWTLSSPYIGAICNCEMNTCNALRFDQGGLRMFYRAEYVAAVDLEKCTGCGACLRSCPFEAFITNEAIRKVFPDPTRCYGCGLCRPSCPQGALYLTDRSSHPVAGRIW